MRTRCGQPRILALRCCRSCLAWKVRFPAGGKRTSKNEKKKRKSGRGRQTGREREETSTSAASKARALGAWYAAFPHSAAHRDWQACHIKRRTGSAGRARPHKKRPLRTPFPPRPTSTRAAQPSTAMHFAGADNTFRLRSFPPSISFLKKLSGSHTQ